MAKFKKEQYLDLNGKTPSDYLCELLDNGTNVIKLATYIRSVPNEGVLIGKALYKMKKPAIGLWVLRQGKYNLFYSFYKDRNEICFLYLFHGIKPEREQPEAIKRIKQFYNLQ